MSQTRDGNETHDAGLSRREFVVAGALGMSAVSTRPLHATAIRSISATSVAQQEFELEEVTLQVLQEGMQSGRWTARSITELYLNRIQRLDRNGPTVRSVIETNPDAVDIAERLDDERRTGQVRGPLHGIPILLKDNVDTADRMTTTAGSYALEGSIPVQDSFVAQQLREAGAVLLGKANLSEWANFRSTRSSSGWSGRGGQCANPYALDRNPCGSSSGSAAATSANFVAAAIGTETNGSVVCPASVCGVVGIKPTVGLVSRSGIIPIAHTQDTAGPMGRTVTDAALVLGALTGIDSRDTATNASAGNSHTDYTQFLNADGLRGARIGVDRQAFGAEPHVDALMETALESMSQQGAVIVDPADIATRREMGRPSYQVLLYEFKADLRAYLQSLPSSRVRSLADVIDFNDQHREREMPYFGQEIFLQAQVKGPLTSPEYLEALENARRLSRDEGIDAVMNQHQLDAIVTPTTRPAWMTDLVNDLSSSAGSSGPAAIAGYASVTVPVGHVFGLPVGMLFTGRAWSEPTLLKLAYAFEQATMHRRAPRFLRSIEL